MGGYNFGKLKPLDILLAVGYVVLAPLVHYRLPFPISAGVEVILLGLIGILGYLVHRGELQQFKRRQEEEYKTRRSELLGRKEDRKSG